MRRFSNCSLLFATGKLLPVWAGLLLLITSPADAVVVGGIDLTLEPLDVAKVVGSVRGYVDTHGGDGEPVFIVAVSGRTFTLPVILAKAELPDMPGIKGKAKKEALDKLTTELTIALDGRKQHYPPEFFQQSQIAEFFALAASIFENAHTPVKARQLLLISDMLQVDTVRNWETAKEINAADLKVAPVGGAVTIYGVQSKCYVDYARWEKIHETWMSLLGGASLKVLSYASILPQ